MLYYYVLSTIFWNKNTGTIIKVSFIPVCIDNKALYFGLRGKALNIASDYDAKAGECI